MLIPVKLSVPFDPSMYFHHGGIVVLMLFLWKQHNGNNDTGKLFRLTQEYTYPGNTSYCLIIPCFKYSNRAEGRIRLGDISMLLPKFICIPALIQCYSISTLYVSWVQFYIAQKMSQYRRNGQIGYLRRFLTAYMSKFSVASDLYSYFIVTYVIHLLSV